MTLLESSDKDSVDRLFLRIERYMKIINGQKFLDDLIELESENIFENIADYIIEEPKTLTVKSGSTPRYEVESSHDSRA